jgi:sugar lactone lactonase YvrE
MKRINVLQIIVAAVLSLLVSAKQASSTGFELTEIQHSGARWTGVAVSNTGRTFVCYPRCGVIPFSVAEIVNNTLVPFPNSDWNNWGSPMPVDLHFVCAQSLYIDNENNLWVLDAACVNGTIINGGPKLVKIELKNDQITQVVYFDSLIVPQQSFLQDFRIDFLNNIAYITDSGLGAIIIADLVTGQSRRILENHYSVKAENITLNVNGQNVSYNVHADGLALSNDRKYLYYKALTGYTLYRIKTQALLDTTLTASELEGEVEFVAVTVPCESIEFDSQNNLYFTSFQDNSIYYLTPDLNFELAISDDRLKWPDGLSITSNDEIFLTTSRLFFYQPGLHGLFKLDKIPSAIHEEGADSENSAIVLQNFPNPFHSATRIEYTVSDPGNVTLKIIDLTGKAVAVLVDDYRTTGTYLINFDAGNFERGMYLGSLCIGNKCTKHKMLIL